MDDWYPPSGQSSWHRIQGDGEPNDYSAGSSAAGDWRGEPEPVPQVFVQAFEADPVPVVQSARRYYPGEVTDEDQARWNLQSLTKFLRALLPDEESDQ